MQKRLETSQKKGLSEEKAAELKLKRQKDDLIGKITHYYYQVGRDPPFGLVASPIGTLKKQLQYAKNLKRS